MNIINFTGVIVRRISLLVAISCLSCSFSAWASNLSITAKFTPDPNNPRVNTFVNTTINTGYCTGKYVQECQANKTFSIRASNGFMSKSIKKGDKVSIKAPGDWKKLTVVHPVGGPQEVEVRVVGMGSEYVVSPNAFTITGIPPSASNIQLVHAALWGGGLSDWIFAPSPCIYSGISQANNNIYRFLWKVTGAAFCSKTAAYDIPGFSFSYIDFAYELRTPNPLAMQSGIYTGSLTYSLGPGGDFDFNQMTPTDSAITLNFSLEVVHALKIEIPPGGNRIELVPEGGWQRWMNGGKPPPRLFKDQPFLISSSTPFKMYIECAGGSERYCYLSDAGTTSLVPVQVSVTLPSGFIDRSGAPISRRELSHIQGATAASSGAALQVRPSYYVERTAAMLHFEVPKEGIVEVFRKDGPSHYSGKITVIWDADI